MSRRPERTARQRLEDILDSISRIEQFVEKKTFNDFFSDAMLRDAVERNVERISEASRHLPNELTSEYADIPWRAIGDIGNIFRHAYDDVDARQTWEVVTRDLAPLKDVVRAMRDRLATDR